MAIDKSVLKVLKKVMEKDGEIGVVVVWSNNNEMIAYTCKDFGQVQELIDHVKKAGTIH